MIRQPIIIALSILLTACASSPPKDVSGFSGYAFGSSYDFVLADMRTEGGEPKELTTRAQWYVGNLKGYPVEFAYVFEGGLLVSGMWVFQDTSFKSF